MGIKRSFVSRIASLFHPAIWQALLGIDLVLPRYHLVSDEEPLHVRGLHIFRTTDQFEKDMRYFINNFTPVSLQDVIDHLEGKRRLTRRSFLPTFDDGFKESEEVIAETLSRLGIPAVFFINSSVIDNRDLLDDQKKCLIYHALVSSRNADAVAEVGRILCVPVADVSKVTAAVRQIDYSHRRTLDRLATLLDVDYVTYRNSIKPYLTVSSIRNMIKRGFEFGAHSDDHPRYSTLTIEEQLAHTKASVDYFEQHDLGRCRSFAFPYSDRSVSPLFFERIRDETALQITFGADGIQRHFAPYNLERFKMDYPYYNASDIMSREFALALIRNPKWQVDG